MSEGHDWEAKIAHENIGLYRREGVIVIKVPELIAVGVKRAVRAGIMPQMFHGVRRDGLFIAAPDHSDKVDFMGTTGHGQAVAFDAKSVRGEDTALTVYDDDDGLTLRQRNFLASFTRAGAIAFVYVEWRRDNSRWVLPVDERGLVAGVDLEKRKSFPLHSADPKWRVPDGDTWLDHFRAIHA